MKPSLPPKWCIYHSPREFPHAPCNMKKQTKFLFPHSSLSLFDVRPLILDEILGYPLNFLDTFR